MLKNATKLISTKPKSSTIYAIRTLAFVYIDSLKIVS